MDTTISKKVEKETAKTNEDGKQLSSIIAKKIEKVTYENEYIHIGNYKFKSGDLIGKGGFAHVYKGYV